MRYFNAQSNLEAYLRLSRAAGDEWLAAIEDVLSPAVYGCYLSNPQGVVGSMSVLEVDAGTVCVLELCQGMELTCCRLQRPLVVWSVTGECNLTLHGAAGLSLYPLAVIPANSEFTLSAGDGSRLILVLPMNCLPQRRPCHKSSLAIASEIQRFMLMSGYLQDHQHACRVARDLFLRIDDLLARPVANACEDIPELDRRLVRVIEKIQSEPQWEFDLAELAKHAGVSERNLYYLMRRETGLTPYRYYQRCRLIRVRRRLVDCQCDVPHISWYAADEGFTHLGRFAALYRAHFGELPSETVQWRRSLQARDQGFAELA
ncbi:MAG TPA: AraC family transcriptional regulator [Marinobacter sp.]|nr:AraC family transcriptional regulator [Marinobacter sp.]